MQLILHKLPHFGLHLTQRGGLHASQTCPSSFWILCSAATFCIKSILLGLVSLGDTEDGGPIWL